MKKSFKDLFIVSNKGEEKKEEKFTSKFPETNSFTFPNSGGTDTMERTAPPVPTAHIPLECAPHMDAIMKLYEQGFAGLNKPGIDFFEFFEAVIDSGIDNPLAYKMAFNMLSKMDKSITKDSLIGHSQDYVNELSKIHAGYDATGIKKKGDLISEKNAEDQKLKSDVQLLKDQLETIKSQISAKEMQLSQIDNKYLPKINELDCKISANNEAKNRIISTINKVVSGIKSNL